MLVFLSGAAVRVLLGSPRPPAPRARNFSPWPLLGSKWGIFGLRPRTLQSKNLLKCPTRRAKVTKVLDHKMLASACLLHARVYVPADSCSLQREALDWLILLAGLAGMSPSSELRSGAWLPGSLGGWLRGTTRQSPLEGVSFRAPHCYRPYGIVRKQTNDRCEGFMS